MRGVMILTGVVLLGLALCLLALWLVTDGKWTA